MKSKAFAEATWVRRIFLIGGLLLVAGIMWDYPIVKRALIARQKPSTNKTYDKLVAAAKRSFRSGGIWHLQGGDIDLDVVDVPANDAFGPIKVDGLRLEVVERLYLPVLTDRKLRSYDVYFVGNGVSKREPIIQVPGNRTAELFDADDGVRSYVAAPLSPTQETLQGQSHTAKWRSATVLGTGQGLKRPPLFDPTPTYQMDIFTKGYCTGSFAAWNDESVSPVRWYTTDKNGNREGKPKEATTQNLDL